MHLSKRTQYGLRAMICLADAYQRGYLQTKELAAREDLPIKFLESILSALTRGKFLNSKIGATGGYRLAQNPKDIKVADLISRLEGRQLFEEEETEPESQGRPGQLAVHLLEAQLSQALRREMDRMTLADLAEDVAQNSRGGQMYYI